MSLSWEHDGQLPTTPAPPGQVSDLNLKDTASLHRYDDTTQAVCLTVTTLFILVRVWTKGYVLRRLGWDDLTAVLAWLGLIACAVVYLLMDKFGNGHHLWDVKGDDFTEYMKLTNVSQIIYGPVIFLAKLSLVLLFLRVFAPRRFIRVSLHLVLWSNFLFYTAGVFVEIWQCYPRMKAWLPLLPGRCVNQVAIQLTSGVFNTVSDFAILIIPMTSVWNLPLPAKSKWGLLAVFGTGLLACIASLTRMIIILQKLRKPVTDPTWEWYSLNLCSAAEIACGIICGCIPPLPAFLRFLRGKPPLSQSSITIPQSASFGLSSSRSRPMIVLAERKDEFWEGLPEA